MSALNVQIAGSHYKSLSIQPVEYIHANGIGYFEGNVIKYVTRWKEKNGVADLEKAKHYIELLIELTQSNAVPHAHSRAGATTHVTPGGPVTATPLSSEELEEVQRRRGLQQEMANLQLREGFPHNPNQPTPY